MSSTLSPDERQAGMSALISGDISGVKAGPKDTPFSFITVTPDIAAMTGLNAGTQVSNFVVQSAINRKKEVEIKLLDLQGKGRDDLTKLYETETKNLQALQKDAMAGLFDPERPSKIAAAELLINGYRSALESRGGVKSPSEKKKTTTVIKSQTEIDNYIRSNGGDPSDPANQIWAKKKLGIQ